MMPYPMKFAKKRRLKFQKMKGTFLVENSPPATKV